MKYHKLLTSLAPILNANNINIANRIIIYSHINDYLHELEYNIEKMEKRIKYLETINLNNKKINNINLDTISRHNLEK